MTPYFKLLLMDFYIGFISGGYILNSLSECSMCRTLADTNKTQLRFVEITKSLLLPHIEGEYSLYALVQHRI